MQYNCLMKETPEPQWEDSYQKSERLYKEAEKLRAELLSLGDILKKEYEAMGEVIRRWDALDEKYLLRTKSEGENVDFGDFKNYGDELTVIKSDFVGIQGDASGTRSLMKSCTERIMEIVEQLKEINETR